MKFLQRGRIAFAALFAAACIAPVGKIQADATSYMPRGGNEAGGFYILSGNDESLKITGATLDFTFREALFGEQNGEEFGGKVKASYSLKNLSDVPQTYSLAFSAEEAEYFDLLGGEDGFYSDHNLYGASFTPAGGESRTIGNFRYVLNYLNWEDGSSIAAALKEEETEPVYADDTPVYVYDCKTEKDFVSVVAKGRASGAEEDCVQLIGRGFAENTGYMLDYASVSCYRAAEKEAYLGVSVCDAGRFKMFTFGSPSLLEFAYYRSYADEERREKLDYSVTSTLIKETTFGEWKEEYAKKALKEGDLPLSEADFDRAFNSVFFDSSLELSAFSSRYFSWFDYDLSLLYNLNRAYCMEISLQAGEEGELCVTTPLWPTFSIDYEPIVFSSSFRFRSYRAENGESRSYFADGAKVNVFIKTSGYLVLGDYQEFERTEEGYAALLETPDSLWFDWCESENPEYTVTVWEGLFRFLLSFFSLGFLPLFFPVYLVVMTAAGAIVAAIVAACLNRKKGK